MSRRRPHTISVSLENRGQTTQDFAVGIGVFLLAIAFVFSFVPSIITPFSSTAGGDSAQAERIAGEIVDNVSENPNELDSAAFLTNYTDAPGELNETLGLRATDDVSIDRVNITVVSLEDGEITETADGDLLEAGDDYREQSAASVSRVVTVTDGECEPACRLIVRVW